MFSNFFETSYRNVAIWHKNTKELQYKLAKFLQQ